MERMKGMWTSIIGILGVIVGVLLNEIIRRNRRIEIFTPSVFEKRLTKYEKLMALLQTGYDVASDIMVNVELSQEQRDALISEAIFKIAEYTDKEELYIDSNLSAHCTATFMGAEDVISIQDQKKREEAKQMIQNMYKEAKRMIKEDSGVHEIDKLFKKINKPKLKSPVIDCIKYLKKHPDKLKALKTDEENL